MTANTSNTAIRDITAKIDNPANTAKQVITAPKKQTYKIVQIFMDQMGLPYDSMDCLLLLNF